MTQTHDETQAALDNIAALMIEKGVKTPAASFTQRSQSGCSVHLSGHHTERPFEGKDYKFIRGNTVREVLDAARAYVEAMPDPETAALKAWHGKLANVIDEGHALALPDEVMTPLRQGSQAMTENLIAGPGMKP